MTRYWAMMTCAAMGEKASSIASEALPLLEDSQEVVRIRAAEFLGCIGKVNPQTTLIKLVNNTSDPIVATEALNAVVLFRDFYGDKFSVTRDDFNPIVSGADMDDRLNYINGIPYPPKNNPRAPKGKN